MTEYKKGDLVKMTVLQQPSRNRLVWRRIQQQLVEKPWVKIGDIGIVIEYKTYQANRAWDRVWKVYVPSIGEWVWASSREFTKVSNERF